jgi:hypothetical protein
MFNFEGMKSTLVIETRKPGQLEVLMRVAREMGIRVSLLNDAFAGMSEKEEQQLWLQLAESSMAEEWNDQANDQWDEFFATAPKL